MGWVEVVTLVFLAGVGAGIVVPRALQFRDAGVARDAVAEFEALHDSAEGHRASTGGWPADGAPAFTVQGDRYTLVWRHWPLPDGLPRHPDIQVVAGITLITDRPRVAEAVGRGLANDGAWYAMGDRYTFILEGI